MVVSVSPPGDFGELSGIHFPSEYNYQASVFARGLAGPDGLAMSPDGVLHVAEESAGRVSGIYDDGTVFTVVSGLDSPEGIAFDSLGNLYITEDTANGRIVMVSPCGDLSVVADRLDAPEGIAVRLDGSILVCESSVEHAGNPLDFITGIDLIFPGVSIEPVIRLKYFFSFSDLVVGSNGVVYVANEASGTGSDWSILSIDPVTWVSRLFCSGLISCEGLCLQPGGFFPMLVAEENTESGGGRLSLVNEDGSTSILASGFLSLEDVLVDNSGYIYVSEDASGQVIRLVPSGFSP